MQPQETAGELVRMGIDPAALGLAPEPVAPAPAPYTGSGRAPAPARHRSTVDAAAALEPFRPGEGRVGEGRPGEGRPLAPAGWRRLLRAAGFGLLQPGAAAAMQREHRLVARVRTRQRGPRVVAFVAGRGGAGTTTTAMGVAGVLAALRNDATALVDARHGTGSIGQRVAGLPAPTILDLVDGDRAAPLAAGGLRVVDAPPWHSPVTRARLLAVLDALRGEHPFVAVDAGNDTGEAAHAVFTRADQMVVVAAAGHDAVDAARVALDRIHEADPYRVGTTVVALVCLNPRSHRTAARVLRQDPRVVVVPYDPGLAVGGRFHPERLRTATREAYLRLASLVADPGPASAPRLSLVVPRYVAPPAEPPS